MVREQEKTEKLKYLNVFLGHQSLSTRPENFDDVSDGHSYEQEERSAEVANQVCSVVEVGVVDPLDPG